MRWPASSARSARVRLCSPATSADQQLGPPVARFGHLVLGGHQWFAFTAATTLIFGAAYTLWMVKRVYFGDIANDHVRALDDINAREFLVLGLLAAAVLAMGIYPKPFTDVMDASVAELLRHVAASKLP